jgi:FkbM family methyltransferase
MEELALSCYGVEVRLADAAGLGLCQHLRDTLPPEFVPSGRSASATVSYAVTADTSTPGRAGYRVARDGVEVLVVPPEREEDLLRWLQHDIDNSVARRSPQVLFVHAGVVGWRGLAIVVPGLNLSGKTTLVEAFVGRGAIYYSDEFAVLDRAGMVHPYAKALNSSNRDRPSQDLRLKWEDLPREPLRVGLIVAGPYQPEAAWRPAILRGAQAVLPLTENAVLAHEKPDWTRQIATSVAPAVVTLQGPRPDAAEVAARLLDLIDTALVSQAFDADEVGPSRLTADLARVAEMQFASQGVWPLPPARRLIAARYVQMTDFLSPEDHQRLLDLALACEDVFQHSAMVSGDPLEKVWDAFDRRLRAILPSVRQELGLPWFPLGDIERQLTARSGTGFYALHTGGSDASAPGRRVSCVYHFCARPRRFTGGELKLYDTWVMDADRAPAQSYTTLIPDDNSLVFFPSDAQHEVCPVHPDGEAFRDNYFAVTIWFHEGAWPATVAGASGRFDKSPPATAPITGHGDQDADAGAKTSPRTEDHLLRRAALMRNHGIDLVLDVGANKGQFGSSLRKEIGYRGRIVSFEPLSEAFADLRRIATGDAAWSCHNFALGEETGSATINISANSHSSSLLPVNERTLEIEPSVAYVGREPVKLRRLDDVFAEVVRPGETPYLKIDTQGYETKVLRGGLNVLERFRLIQLETSFFPVYKDEPLIGEVIQFLAALGFRVISFEPGWEDPRTGEMLQADLIFART